MPTHSPKPQRQPRSASQAQRRQHVAADCVLWAWLIAALLTAFLNH